MCRAGLGGSIKYGGRPLAGEARHRNELARAGASLGLGRGRNQGRGGGHDDAAVTFIALARPDGQATDLAVAQAVVAEGEDLAGDGDLGDLAAAAFGDAFEVSRSGPPPWLAFWAASTSAQRSGREPSPEMWPSRALASELRTVGVSPAQAHRWRALGKRVMSPISAIDQHRG